MSQILDIDIPPEIAVKTPQDLIRDEQALIRANPMLLVEHGFLTIKTKSGNLVKLELNSVQKKFLKFIKDIMASGKPVRIWVLKARQMGISTVGMAIDYAYASQKSAVNSLIVADDIDGANYLFGMQKLFQEMLDVHLKPEPKHSNEKKLEFEGIHSQILIDTSDNLSAGRKYTFRLVHLSEASRFRDLKELMLGINQSVPNLPGTFIIAETTANGISNQFYDEWQRCKKDEKDGFTDWKTFFAGWFEMEEYRMSLDAAYGRLYPIEAVIFKNVTDVDDFIAYEQVIKQRYGLSDEQLNWRRWCIVNNCNGSVLQFNQEYPDCIVGDTLISSESKGIFKIRDTEIDKKITKLFNNGMADVFTVRTKAGRILEGTAKHHIHLPDGNFKKLGELKTGDSISLKPPFFAKNKFILEWNDTPIKKSEIIIDKDIGRFLGYFMGDGSFSCETLSIACYKDIDVIEDLQRLIYKIIGKEAVLRETGKKQGNSWELRVGSIWIKEFLDKTGSISRYKSKGINSGIKRNVCVPKCIFQSPKEVIREFLKGIFEADGFIGYKTARIVLFSQYENFLRDIQLLLLGFGITSSVHIADKKTGERTYIGRELRLKALETRLFMKEVGFCSKRKNDRVNSLPTQIWKTRKIEMVDEIESITYGGVKEVFDITVEPEHIYSANGLLVHNCAETAFISTGDLFFDKEALIRQEIMKPLFVGNIVKDNGYQFRQMASGSFKIYEMPKKNEQYVIGADPAEGLEHGDKSAAVVLNKRTNKTVCVYNHNSPPDRFEEDLIKAGHFYNEAVIACESKGYGYSVNQGLYKNYGRVYRKLNTKKGFKEPAMDLGFNTNSVTRPMMLAQMDEEIRNQSTELCDGELINQCWTFINNLKRGQPEADRGKSDDMVLSRAIAGQVRCEQPFKERFVPIKIKKRFRGLCGY